MYLYFFFYTCTHSFELTRCTIMNTLYRFTCWNLINFMYIYSISLVIILFSLGILWLWWKIIKQLKLVDYCIVEFTLVIVKPIPWFFPSPSFLNSLLSCCSNDTKISSSLSSMSNTYWWRRNTIEILKKERFWDIVIKNFHSLFLCISPFVNFWQCSV